MDRLNRPRVIDHPETPIHWPNEVSMRTLLISVLTLLPLLNLRAVQASPGFPVGEKFLKGYAKEISGQVLSYWSFHPLAKQALLSRATTGEMAIEWETEALPAANANDRAHFLWIGAFATGTSTDDHEFELFVNGTRTLTFRTLKGGHYDDWTVAGREGAALSYKHVWKDHVNDAHGYFCLTVPPSKFPSGRPLRLKVIGRKAESRDWYMTFQYAVKESAMVRSQPFLLHGTPSALQPLEVDIDLPAQSGTVEIAIAGKAPTRHSLALGWNAIELTVDAVKRETTIPLEISVNGAPAQHVSVTLRPVVQRTIALLAHSHNDIGYSDLQTTVLDLQIQNIRDALKLIEKTRDYPPSSRFKWNVEILWPIDSLLQKASPGDRQAFLAAVREGSIGLNAMYVNPLTGIARPEVLMHLMEFAQELRTKYDIEIPTAMISDIPGTSWGLVPALAQSGVRYFTSGPNAGDRIGHYADAWGDKPFYWVSASGKDSVLRWVAGTGYSLFHATRTFAENQVFRQKLHDYLERLDSRGYPYELVQMRYSIYADNGMTDSTMPDFVRAWNERHLSPRLRIATSTEIFREFEQRYGASLPSYAGDITPYWEDGAASTAFELGLVTRASERIVQAGILKAMTEPGKSEHPAYSDAWDAVNLWIEHTWGAWNSVSDPDEPGAVAQWRIKKEFAHTADARATTLMESALAGSGPGQDRELEVINTASWPRSDVVLLPAALSPEGNRVLDASGAPVLSQRLSSGELAFVARNIPAFGSLRYRVVPGEPPAGGNARARRLTMTNGDLELALDGGNGSVRSLRSAADGMEYVKRDEARGLNEFIYVAGLSPSGVVPDSVSSVSIGENGPLVASLVVESRSAGCNSVRREIRLYDGFEWIDIINTIDKQPVRTKEAVYFRFPFDVPGETTRMDLGWTFIRPELDQLPGSCKDFYSVQRWVDVSGPGKGITWTTAEAPLVELGQIADETHHNDGPRGWKTKSSSSAVIYSWLMNNYWHTNYKADQEGTSTYHYSVRPHQGFDPVSAYRFGIERNQPLLVRAVEPERPRPGLPFVLESPRAAMTWISPTEEGDGYLVRLYNPSSEQVRVQFLWRDRKAHRTFRTTAFGEKITQTEPTVELGKFESATFLLER